MLQIYWQRPWQDEKSKKWQTPFKPVLNQTLTFPTLADLFEKSPSWLARIPETERHNLFYTLNPQQKNDDRKARHIENLAFDIDKIEADLTPENVKNIFEISCAVLKIDPAKTACVKSGNGIHIVFSLADGSQIEPERMEEQRPFYKALCTKLEAEIYDALKFRVKLDPSIFDDSRVLRLPGTKNVKPNKELGETWAHPTRIKDCVIMQSVVVPQDFSLVLASGLPKILPSDSLSELDLKAYPEPDVPAVLAGCSFLKWAKEKPQEVQEPLWYAMLSILGHCSTEDEPSKGRELAHIYSSGHPGYSAEETNDKLGQAMAASGPRTCSNINNLWGNCHTCPYYKKVQSPIRIEGEGFIKTKATGFYATVIDGNKVKVGKPAYSDLLKWFTKKHPFISVKESIYTFNGTHWVDFDHTEVKAFAEKWFKPDPSEAIRNEFLAKVKVANLRSPDWFDTSIDGFFNFKNGVLDSKKRELIAHSREFGFRSVLPFDYDPAAECPRFEEFLDQVTCKEKELKNVLVEFMGYCLSGMRASSFSKALVLYGDGANGKSVFLDVLRHLVGRDYYSVINVEELSNVEKRQGLDGKLFNVVEEMSPQALNKTSDLKAIIAGGEIQVRKLYSQAYTIENRAKLIMACNKLPTTTDLSKGLYRRLLIAPFRATFEREKEDRHIRGKLAVELPGIFNLALGGLDRLIAQNQFTDSRLIEKTLQDFKEEMDNVVYWNKNYVELDAQEADQVSSDQAYKMYCSQMMADNLKPVQKITFFHRIKDMWKDNYYRTRTFRGYNKIKIHDEGQNF